jgi:hypothetical protein
VRAVDPPAFQEDGELAVPACRHSIGLDHCWPGLTAPGVNRRFEDILRLMRLSFTAAKAGILYTLGVFAVAFAVGVIRVTQLAPRVGDLMAVLCEAPVVLGFSWAISRWCIGRLKVDANSSVRIQMGVVAFVTLQLLELGVSVLAFGETPGGYFAKFATAPGLAGLIMQAGFAAIPWIQWRVR